MARFAVVKRQNESGILFYVAPGELILDDGESSVYTSSNINDCDIKCTEFAETEAARQKKIDAEQTPTNTQSAAIAQIAADMERLVGDVYESDSCQVITCITVAKWARQLRAL